MLGKCLVNSTSVCTSTDFGSYLFVHLLNTLLLSQISLKHEFHPDRSNKYLPEYDFIIIGAGSAGSSLSASLASNPDWNVLLIEAGTDPDINSYIPLLFATIQKTNQDWQYLTEPQPNSCLGYRNRQCAWPRGKLMGGTSAINAMIYCTGNPRDYDEWELLGNRGWSWKNVRKYFANQMKEKLQPALVDKLDANVTDNIISHTRNVILNAGREMGYPYTDDPWKQSQGTTGFYDVMGTIRNGERISSARAYVMPILKQKNFHLIKNGHVTKILIDSKTMTAQGVQVQMYNGELIEIRARKEVISSAGAINTPQILMLSGIGPKQHLMDLGIEPIVDLPVGEHLFDHPAILVPLTMHHDRNLTGITNDEIYKYFTKRQGLLATTSVANIVAYFDPRDSRNQVGEVSFHFAYFEPNSSAVPRLPMNFDNYLKIKLNEANKKSSLFMIYLNLLRPKSEGFVKLKSTNPFNPPIIDPKTHEHPDDLQVLLGGYRTIQKMIRTRAMQAEGVELLELKFKDCEQYEYNSDEHIICIMKHLSSTVYHPVGTARMGISLNDSVVDPRLCVRDVKHLRVADASIMPRIVGGNTNAPSIMIGQKAGDLIKQDWLNFSRTEL